MATAVCGAGGPAGLECVKALVNAKREVRCLVRDPEKHSSKFTDLAPPGSNLVTVVKGDVSDPASLAEALPGSKKVIFAASASGFNDAGAVDHKGVANVAEASKKAGVDRVVLISSCLVTKQHRWNPIRMMLNNVKWSLMDSKLKGEEALRSSGVPYTIVRPGQLADGLPAGEALQVGQGDKQNGKVTRADLAGVCVAALDSPAVRNTTFEVFRASPSAPAAADQMNKLFAGLKPDAELGIK